MFRFRNLFLILGSAAGVAWLFITDPDKGDSTTVMLMGVMVCILGVAFAHLSRKALSDYPEADMRKLFRKAMESPSGAGLALVAQAIIISALLGLFGSRVHAATPDPRVDIPTAAIAQIPVLKAEARLYWPDHPAPEVLASLVEQESCITLRHRFCWSPQAQLKTPREEGAGVGQITRAWRTDGTLRFDTLAELRGRHDELRGLTWSNVYRRPDLQFRALVLMQRDLYNQVRRVVHSRSGALAFADAAYNGGFNGMQADRRACGLRTGCNPQQWFGHVEVTCTKSRAKLYGKRSACDINREHVRNVIQVRALKYRALMLTRSPATEVHA